MIIIIIIIFIIIIIIIVIIISIANLIITFTVLRVARVYEAEAWLVSETCLDGQMFEGQ